MNGDGKALSVTRGLVTATELQQSLTNAVTSFHSQVHFVLCWHKPPSMALKQAVNAAPQLLSIACAVDDKVSTDGNIMSSMQGNPLPPQPVQSPSRVTPSSHTTAHSTGTTSQHAWHPPRELLLRSFHYGTF